MKNRLLKGEVIELSDEQNIIGIWFQKKTSNFCFMLNGKVIKAVKTWLPIQNKLNEFNNLTEVH